MMDPYREYIKNQVHTASPAERLLIVFQRLDLFIKQAEEAYDKGDMKEFNNQLLHAQTAVTVLKESLDFSYDLSKSLYALYDYIEGLLIEANLKKSLTPLAEAKNLATQLHEAWRDGLERHAVATPAEA